VTPPLPTWAKRILAFGLLGMPLVAAWACVVVPIGSAIRLEAESRGIALRTLARDRALIHAAPAIEAAASAVNGSPRWRNFYAEPKTEAATLQLEMDLRSLVADPHNLTSMTAEPPRTQGPVTGISVRVTLTMPMDELAALLDRIQKFPKQLRVTNLTIQAPDFQTPQTNPTLTIQALIAGWTIKPEADGG
jgi:hypothetical protein